MLQCVISWQIQTQGRINCDLQAEEDLGRANVLSMQSNRRVVACPNNLTAWRIEENCPNSRNHCSQSSQCISTSWSEPCNCLSIIGSWGYYLLIPLLYSTLARTSLDLLSSSCSCHKLHDYRRGKKGPWALYLTLSPDKGVGGYLWRREADQERKRQKRAAKYSWCLQSR